MSGPAVYDLSIYQGDTFTLKVRLRTVNPDHTLGAYINLAGAALRAQVRGSAADASFTEFTITADDQTVNTGGATLELSSAQTTALTPGNEVWDLQLTDAAGKVRTLLRGNVTLTGQVTR